MNRLFTLGCSFTAYHYPTWADVAGTAFDYFENWGKPNSGNNYILNSLTELHLRNNLTEDDSVYIMWSGIARQDYYQINEWLCEHNVFKKSGFSCPKGYEILNYGWFSAAQHLLDNIGVNWRMWSWQAWDPELSIAEIYKPVLDKIEYAGLLHQNKADYPYVEPIDGTLLYERQAGDDWPALSDIFQKKYSVTDEIQQEIDAFLQAVETLKQQPYGETDLHPSPLVHLKFVEDRLPELNISSETRDWVEHIDQCLLDNKPFHFQGSTVRSRL